MVNKLLIGLGVLTLVAIGSVGVWKLSDADRNIGALGPLEKPVPLSWRGSWTDETRYDVGQVVSYEGASYVAEAANGGQVPNAKEGPWALMAATGLQGAQGPTGSFGGTLQSPDGKWTLSVTNAGIDARGPGGQLTMDGTGVAVKSAARLVVDAGSVLELKAAASASIRGSLTNIGCASGGAQAVRVGNPVQVSGNGSVGPGGGGFNVSSTGTLQHGSPIVFIC